jgi:hypothetical protein
LPNISPVAFLIDRCQNIYVSGWGGWILGGGEVDPYGLQGTSGMPVTADAIKPVSDTVISISSLFKKILLPFCMGPSSGRMTTRTASVNMWMGEPAGTIRMG